MREVLVLSPDFPPERGGIQTLVHRLVSNWQRCRCRVITLDHGGSEAFDRGQPFPIVRVRGGSHQAALLRLNARAAREALRQRPDVIVSAHVVTAPGAQVVRRLLAIPVLQYVYGLEVAASPRLSGFALANAQVTVAISRHTRDLAIRAGASPDRTEVVPPGVDMPDDVRRVASERPTVVTIATLEYRYKGHDVVARALPLVRAAIEDVQWVIVGDGPLRPHIEALVRAHGIGDSVRFVGSVSDAERDDWLRRADAMVMPSRIPPAGLGGEGFGIAYMEAAAHGLSVVGGNVGGTTDAVLDGVTGLLVDPWDHLALADALIGILRNPDARRRMGLAAQRRARELTWPRVARRVEELVLALGPAAIPSAK